MNLTADPVRTENRRRLLEQYLLFNVLTPTEFICRHFSECKHSHPGKFYQGQMHHLGRYYDLFLHGSPFRIVVVGQEYGGGPSYVSMAMRYEMIMHSGMYYLFKAEGSHPGRNPTEPTAPIVVRRRDDPLKRRRSLPATS